MSMEAELGAEDEVEEEDCTPLCCAGTALQGELAAGQCPCAQLTISSNDVPRLRAVQRPCQRGSVRLHRTVHRGGCAGHRERADRVRDGSPRQCRARRGWGRAEGRLSGCSMGCYHAFQTTVTMFVIYNRPIGL